jgi:hypothetical protein
MHITFNPRGNGACPLCKRHEDCTIHDKYRTVADTLRGANGTEMEIVIYTCPFFVETD